MTTFARTVTLCAMAVAGAFVLVAAAPAARADAGSRLERADLDRLGRAIARNEGYVTAEQLTKWLVEERKDFALIDVRTPRDFEAGHIKTATNIAVPDLLTTETLRKLPRDKTLVLYSNATEQAAQAAVVLQLAGLKAYSLLGGFDYWVRYALEPQAAGPADREQLDEARRQAIARHLKECPPCLAAPAAGFTPPVTPAAPGGAAPRILEGGC